MVYKYYSHVFNLFIFIVLDWVGVVIWRRLTTSLRKL